MKKDTHLHTSFVKFIVEKYGEKNKKISDIEKEDKRKVKNKEVEDIDNILNDVDENEKLDKEEQNDDENVDDLLKEYLELEKKYWRVRNDKVYKRQ
ncbi:hypothetical protein [Flavobacterium sp. YJ01]|uniref:hypothetical protein n=1 Tax=unclassified Flavobacterium TaxID=196869 RepID=UPI0023E3E8B8|nr:hypothetical protein [Flavobacterium sp. YJ01]WET00954.1 hypothetical protein P0R33_14355 [Flavobacterium sp. YJ01]